MMKNESNFLKSESAPSKGGTEEVKEVLLNQENIHQRKIKINILGKRKGKGVCTAIQVAVVKEGNILLNGTIIVKEVLQKNILSSQDYLGYNRRKIKRKWK